MLPPEELDRFLAAAPPLTAVLHMGAVSDTTAMTTGASLKPDSASSRLVSRRGRGTLRSTEKTAAASVELRTAPTSSAETQSRSRTNLAATPTTPTDTMTPTVESRAAGATDGLMCFHEVESPPSARIRTSGR